MTTDLSFPTLINKYISELQCTAKRLAGVSGISETLLSRYRSGQRSPSEEQVRKIARGIKELDTAGQFTLEEVEEDLLGVLPKPFPYEQFQKRWSACISSLHINIARMARYLHYDASYLSRITSGQRHPAHPEQFIKNSAEFISKYYSNPSAKQFFADAMEIDVNSITEESEYESLIIQYLMTAQTEAPGGPVEDFLSILNSFDINEYIRCLKNESPDLLEQYNPASPVNKYYDASEKLDAQRALLARLIKNSTGGALYMYDDMPPIKQVYDMESINTWSEALTILLSRGMHVYSIHYVDRPVNEILRWLIMWIPLYMTGQVHPYYYPKQVNTFFMHSLTVSDQICLFGERVPSHNRKTTYFLTDDPQGIDYFMEQVQFLLSKAKPLIEFYDLTRKEEYIRFIRREMEAPGSCHRVLDGLPFNTLSESLLRKLLDYNFVKGEEREKIIEYAHERTKRMEGILSHDKVIDEITVLSKAEFDKNPQILSIPAVFLNRDVNYSYDMYVEHLEATRKFAEENPNYILKEQRKFPYRNLQLVFKENGWVIISKNNAPAIHILIRHERVCKALESLIDKDGI